jgi:hypothetical protein
MSSLKSLMLDYSFKITRKNNVSEKIMKVQQAEEKVSDAIREYLNTVYDMSNEHDGPGDDAAASFLITFVRRTPDNVNPSMDDLSAYGMAITPTLPCDPDGNLLNEVSLGDTSTPIETRLSLAMAHLWNTIIPDLLGQSPTVHAAGSPPAKPDSEPVV